MQSITKREKYNEICTRVGGSHHPRMAETIYPVQEVIAGRMILVVDDKSFLSRLKELLEQYKLEIPDPEFADDNVIERETRRIRVKMDAKQF